MLIKILPGIAGLIAGLAIQKTAYDEKGMMKGKTFLISESISLIAQIYLVYEYIELRGGFKVHDCIWGVTLALLFGAVVLWLSKMLYAFDHEGFRVLLGVAAITGGWLVGNGFDLIVAWNQGQGILDSSLAVYLFALGAIGVVIGDAALALKAFQLKATNKYDMLYLVSTVAGIALITIATVL